MGCWGSTPGGIRKSLEILHYRTNRKYVSSTKQGGTFPTKVYHGKNKSWPIHISLAVDIDKLTWRVGYK